MDHPESGRHRLLNWLPLPVLLVTLLATGIAVYTIHRHDEALASEQLNQYHQTLTQRLAERINGLTRHGWLAASVSESNDPELRRKSLEALGEEPGLLSAEFLDTLPAPLAAIDDRIVATSVMSDTQSDASRVTVTRLFIPASNNEWLSLTVDPARWLQDFIDPHVSAAIQLTVHDLSQHEKVPLVSFIPEGELAPDRALRSIIAFGNRQWMLTSTPSDALKAGTSHIFVTGLIGGVLGIIAALVVVALTRQLRLARAQRERSHRTNVRLGQQLDNSDVEKRILKQALGNSELRSRDLVELIGGFVCELDDQLRIVYISPQVDSMLDLPPAEMVEKPFEQWVSPPHRENFAATVQAARREKHMQRVDLDLLAGDDTLLLTTLRVKAVSDPLSGCTGYRMTAQRSLP